MVDIDFAQLVQQLPKASVVVDADHRIVYVNAAASELLGLPDDADLLDRDLLDFVHPSSRASVLQRFTQVLDTGAVVRDVEEQALHADGRQLLVGTVASPTTYQDRPAVHLILWLLDEDADAAAHLAFQATHDTLTGLPNRALLEDRWAQARARARRSDDAVFVLFCDIDGFKAVNDAHGHRVGDEVLRSLAAALAAAVRARDTLARIGGDEFVALVETPDPEQAAVLADRLRAAVAGLGMPGLELELGLSVGIEPDDPSRETVDVLARADALMYEEKRRSG